MMTPPIDPSSLDRRTAITALGAGALALTAAAAAAQPDRQIVRPAGEQPAPRPGALLTPEQLGWDPTRNEYILPPLPYPADALEPHIDAQTMEIHHGRHHKAYVDGLNRALTELGRIRAGEGNDALVKFYSRELAFHGSGHVNHVLFWHIMAPQKQGGGGGGGGGQPAQGSPLAEAINRWFGSFEAFARHFKLAARQVEGSGWAWLVYHPLADRLLVMQGEKQQDMTIWGVIPILGLDVWEHAYYLKYQNRRDEYTDAFMNIINWPRVAQFYDHARQFRPQSR